MKQKFTNALSLALIVAMLFTSVALADNVQNDVVAGGNDTFTAGGSTTVNYRITANSGDGQTGCNAADATPATVTINAPAEVTATPGSLSFTSCDTNKPVVFSSSTPGNYEITVSVSDSGTGTYNTNPAKFTLHVLAAPPPSDTTPPVISYVLNPISPDGSSGWYKSNVTLTWIVTDDESDVTIDDGCEDQNITADQAETTYSCSATSDGGSAGPVNVSIKRDATDPEITFVGPSTSDWYNEDVTVNWSCSDATSGAVDDSVSDLASGEGNAVPATGTCEDHAGNSASDTQYFMIDQTPPVVAVTGVTHNAQYVLGSAPAAGCSTTDGLSGVATYASLSTSGGPVGSITATCSGAFDNAGNAGNTAIATYQVIYAWSGFFQPVDMNAVNVAKAGSAIPVKFSLGGDQGLNIFAAGYPKFYFGACGSGPEDQIETTVTAGGSSLTYDALAGQYIYVWKTDKSWANKCGTLHVTLNDGTTHTAQFKLK